MTGKTDTLLADEAPITELEGLRELIAEGQERGSLTFEAIAACLEEVEITKEQVGELHAFLEDQGVEIVGADGRPVGSAAKAVDGARGGVAGAGGDGEADGLRKVALDLTVEPSLDSLRLYLRPSVACRC